MLQMIQGNTSRKTPKTPRSLCSHRKLHQMLKQKKCYLRRLITTNNINSNIIRNTLIMSSVRLISRSISRLLNQISILIILIEPSPISIRQTVSSSTNKGTDNKKENNSEESSNSNSDLGSETPMTDCIRYISCSVCGCTWKRRVGLIRAGDLCCVA